jgi:hypothetical protein
MTRPAILAIAVAAILASAPPASGAPPLAVETSFSRNWLYFADTVTARVVVLADRHQVDASSIRIRASFDPWQALAPAQPSSEKSGSISRRTWTFTLVCLTLSCLTPSTLVEGFNLPRVTVSARKLDGSSLKIQKSWPKLRAAGRFQTPPSPDAPPAFRLQTGIPPAVYRWSPTSFALMLDVVGAVFIAVAFALVAREFARWSAAAGHRPIEYRPPLVRALALVREAKTRRADDRRRAVGLLARTLPQERDGLTAAASQVAWSRPTPSPDRLEELARMVETDFEEP